MAKKFDPSPAKIAQAHSLHESGATWTVVAASLKCSVTTAQKYAGIWGWDLRSPASIEAGAKSALPAIDTLQDAPDIDAPVNTKALARRVERAVRSELGAIERRLNTSTAASAEKNARILASLVKSLAELRKLDRDDAEVRNRNTQSEGEDDGDNKPPRDMARLRQELADTLARIRSTGNVAASGSDT